MSGQILTLAADAYHADAVGDGPTLSKSVMHELLTKSPKHAWTCHPKLNPAYKSDDDPKYDLGRAAHSLFLEGDGNVEVFIYDDWRSKAAKESRAEARLHGKTPMLGKHWDDVQAMVLALEDGLNASTVDPPLFAEGKPEPTLLWDEDGVPCRARLDWLRDDMTAIDDYKTTSASAKAKVWSERTMYGIGGDLQAAFYLRGLKAVTGADATFRFVVQETYPPFAMSVVTVGADVLALANAKVDRALGIWRRCLETGEWPSYPADAYRAELPAWIEARFLESEAAEEIAA
jgi:hypothetical protein